jgi:hypothetical protein
VTSPWEHPPLHDCAACSRKRETALEAEVERLTRVVHDRESEILDWMKIAGDHAKARATLEAAGTRAQGLEEAAKCAMDEADRSAAAAGRMAREGHDAMAEELLVEQNIAIEIHDRIRALAQRGEGT